MGIPWYGILILMVVEYGPQILVAVTVLEVLIVLFLVLRWRRKRRGC